uniref:Metalloproteinase inhibitor n=1 Tax=Hemiscorpius lepturus TaxID=520031 RepID=A0A4P2UEW3_HEMLE|nr:metalloproteinase inhibitor [Hemiscorpius lepturus]
MVSTCSVVLLALTSFLVYGSSDGCSCMNSHPQEHYCSADFVAVVQVKRARKNTINSVTAYHIRTRRIFKANHKVEAALKHGLLWSSSKANSCGLRLKRRKYLVTGHVTGEKPWVSLCNFVREWSTLTKKQRKGFRRLYGQGCRCKVRAPGFVRFTPLEYTKEHYCLWETAWLENESDCQGRHTMCVPSVHNEGKCLWVHNSAYRHCMKRNRKLKALKKSP